MLYNIRSYMQKIGRRNFFLFNCMAFAVGVTDRKKLNLCVLPRESPDGKAWTAGEAFEDACEKLGICVKRAKWEETGKTYFRVYGWYPCNNFHVIRRDPDGKYRHKPGWLYMPKVISEQELYEDYPEIYELYELC